MLHVHDATVTKSFSRCMYMTPLSQSRSHAACTWRHCHKVVLMLHVMTLLSQRCSHAACTYRYCNTSLWCMHVMTLLSQRRSHAARHDATFTTSLSRCIYMTLLWRHAENRTLSLALDPTFGIRSNKTLDAALPCYLLKPNWKPPSAHSISDPACTLHTINIPSFCYSHCERARACVCACVCVCVCVRACVRAC